MTTIQLDNFEGPIELLFQLVQDSELDIYAVRLQSVTQQFLQILATSSLPIDVAAEFMATASSLIWLKSKTLLPLPEQDPLVDEIEEEPHLEIIHHLVDYCRFKEAAKILSTREEQQQGLYSRGVGPEPEAKKTKGLAHLTLDDLALLFKQVAAKSQSSKGVLMEETWKLADKIEELRLLLKKQARLLFFDLFSWEKARLELIVTFLAVLELMKMGELGVVKDLATEELLIIAKSQ